MENYSSLLEILHITLLSLFVSTLAILISLSLGLPVSIYFVMKNFPFKKTLITILNSFMAIPAVAIGLFLYILLSKNGFLGFLNLLYTPQAIILAQAVLSFPILASLSISALNKNVQEIKETAITLGASKPQIITTLISENKSFLIVAIMTGFSRVIGETGMTLMVGGNIKGFTRVLTTAIALETMKGNFSLGIVLGLILVFLALLINFIIQKLSR